MSKQQWGRGIVAGGAAVVLSGALGACGGMGNNSNPTLSISSARVAGDSASLGLVVSNPSDRDLVLRSIDYSLIYGPLPVASGTWNGQTSLPKGASANLDLSVPFDAPALDPSAGEVQLTGEMRFDDAAGGGNMALQAAGFDATARTSK